MKRTLYLLSLGLSTLHAKSTIQTKIPEVVLEILNSTTEKNPLSTIALPQLPINTKINSSNTKALSSKTQTVRYINNDNYQLRTMLHISDSTQQSIYSKLNTSKKVLDQIFKICNCIWISKKQIKNLLNNIMSAQKFSQATQAIKQKAQCSDALIQSTLRQLIKATLINPNLHPPTYAQYKQTSQQSVQYDDALLRRVYDACIWYIRTQIKKLFLQKDNSNSSQARAIIARWLNEILCNPIGCELLRLIATKTYITSDNGPSKTPSLTIVIYEGWKMEAHFARECVNSSSISLPPSIHISLTNLPNRYNAANLFSSSANKLFIGSEGYSAGQVLFHELLHFLHTLELCKNGTLNNMDFQIRSLIQAKNTTNNTNEYTYNAMKNDEELYTITGLHLRVYTKQKTSIAYFFYDPVSEYSFLKATGKTARIFHQTPAQDSAIQYWEASNAPFITLSSISTLINYQIKNDALAKQQIKMFAQKYKKWIIAAQKTLANIRNNDARSDDADDDDDYYSDDN